MSPTRDLAAILQRIGVGALTVIPLLGAVVFGLTEVLRRGQPIRTGTYLRFFAQVGLLGGCVFLWGAIELAIAVGLRPAWRETATRCSAIFSACLLLASVALLMFQMGEMCAYVRKSFGRASERELR